jgi:hypothetical protein
MEEWIWEEIKERTCITCCMWKNEMQEVEQNLISKILWKDFLSDYHQDNMIRPFYFTLFVLWDKNLSFLDKAEKELPLEYIALKEILCKVIVDHDDISNMSPIDSLVGGYYDEDRSMKEEVGEWFSDNIVLPISTVRIILSEKEIRDINEELLSLCNE